MHLRSPNAKAMKTIYRILTLDIFCYIAEGVALFTFVFLLKQLYRITDLMAAGGTSFFTTLLLLFSMLPSIMVITFPMAALLGTMMVYGRMAHDNELVALQAGGYSTRQLLIPVLIAGILLSGALLWWGHRIAPKGLRIFKSIAAEVLQKTATTGIRPGGFNKLGHFIISPSSIDEGHMRDVKIFEMRNQEIAGVISAPSGTITYLPIKSILNLKLQRGTLHQLPAPDRDVVVKFDEMRFSLAMGGLLDELAKTERKYQQYSSSFIQSEIQRHRDWYKKTGNPVSYELWKIYEVEQITRSAFPAACLVMALIGGILGMNMRSGKRSACYAMTIFVIFVYYVLFSFGKSYAEDGVVPPWIGIWLPNLAGLALFTILYWRSRRA
ncbi:LptF/LptG family permease [bacterium]|nr:LptF/LptG family permease [bacterium]